LWLFCRRFFDFWLILGQVQLSPPNPATALPPRCRKCGSPVNSLSSALARIEPIRAGYVACLVVEFEMLSVFVPAENSLKKLPSIDLAGLPETSVWIDLLNPTPEEDHTVERLAGIAVPTREDMQEIEISSRLYIENGARYMTATLMCSSDTENPRTTAVTFILSGHRLVTVRYDAPKPFMLVENKLARGCTAGITGEMVLMELLDAVIDRNADILERAGGDMDNISHSIFEPEGAARTGHAKRYSDILIAIGRKGDLTSKVRESLVSVGRVVTFVTAAVDGTKWSKEMREQLKTMQRDVVSLTDHASYLSNKITFVLDAMLGVVNLEQNNIIKLFSVMAVVLMPPTLIASIYGMNFKVMPELEWQHGYPIAIVMMVFAAVLPYVFFKWKRWL
jgi:magnesium transporter